MAKSQKAVHRNGPSSKQIALDGDAGENAEPFYHSLQVKKLKAPLTLEQVAQRRRNGPKVAQLFQSSLQAMLSNTEFWRTIEDIPMLLTLLQVNKLLYELLSPRQNLLPFWDIWTKVFRPHTYKEVRVMFALSR